MKIELTPENAAALAKYAAWANQSSAEFHEYLSDNMVALFETSEQAISKAIFAVSNFTPGLMLNVWLPGGNT
jgi:hypothetical protein